MNEENKTEVSVTQMSMWLELNSKKKYSHALVEHAAFSDACLYVLDKCGAKKFCGGLVSELIACKNKSMSEIGEEKCRDLFSRVQAEKEKEGSRKKQKKKKILRIIFAAVGVVVFALVIMLLMFFRNITFKNGITGEYTFEEFDTFLGYEISKAYEPLAESGGDIRIDEDGVIWLGTYNTGSHLELYPYDIFDYLSRSTVYIARLNSDAETTDTLYSMGLKDGHPKTPIVFYDADEETLTFEFSGTYTSGADVDYYGGDYHFSFDEDSYDFYSTYRKK